MSRLIDVNRLEKVLAIMANQCGGTLDILDISNAIELAPTVERPHGEWVEKHCDYGVYYRCSNCHKMPPNYECDYKEGAIKTNFCPNCGADMRKEGEAE